MNWLIAALLYAGFVWFIIRGCQWIHWIDLCADKATREFLAKQAKLKNLAD